jgi:hypothetical protein
MFILMILYDFCFLPAKFWYHNLIHRKVESHLQSAEWCACNGPERPRLTQNTFRHKNVLSAYLYIPGKEQFCLKLPLATNILSASNRSTSAL